MVRLVFRPYAQIRRSICTSEPLRPSTRVSSGFSLFRHSSPSFGSQQARSCSTPRTRPMGSAGDAPNERISPRLPSLCFRVSYCPTPRARVRLLGPCFKTGRRRGQLKPQTPGVWALTRRRPCTNSRDCEQFPKPYSSDQHAACPKTDAESLLGRRAEANRTPITLFRRRATLRTTKVSPATGRGPRRTLVQRRDASATVRVSEDHSNSRTALAAPENVRRLDGRLRLPPSGFTYSLTLSSKCFSTFPHGTCSLSVSSQYLALDGVYHPLRAAFPNNPTPGKPLGRITTAAKGLTPALGKGLDQKNVGSRWFAACWIPYATFPRPPKRLGFSAGLIPLHSPLLGESLLVSFPPLSDMLKFSGSSRPISGQKWCTIKVHALCTSAFWSHLTYSRAPTVVATSPEASRLLTLQLWNRQTSCLWRHAP